MCGIIGYVGKKEASSVMLEGLRKLEYRGYDSAGMAIIDGTEIGVRKRTGRIESLSELLKEKPIGGHIGISHTRWATHGPPSDANAHPHFDASGRLALVHNGVIENYKVLRAKLEASGHSFESETDSEVLAHLIGVHYDESSLAHSPRRLVEAVRGATKEIKGTYGIAVIHQR